MGLAFVPLYIKYMGIEAYGLVGLFALLQSWLALLDVGLTPALSREMARYEAGFHTPQSICNLMRSIERVYFGIAASVVITVLLGATWLSTNWVHTEKLATLTVKNALAVTGFVIGLRWLSTLYRSALYGLQHQVWLNYCGALFSTVRSVGSIVVLAFVSPNIVTFFVYQSIVIGLETLALAIRVRQLLPTPPTPARFSWRELHKIWRFAAGMAIITLLSILLMQADKLVLSKILSLSDFGYYALASTVAGALGLVIAPISNAVYPRVTEFVVRGESDSLARAYHNFAQMLTLMVVPASIVLSLFARHVLLLWTRDLRTTDQTASLVSVLVIGVMLNGLMHTPYTLQLAHGWTRFMVVVNTIAVVIVIPSIYIGVRAYGPICAAYIWTLLNAAYILVAVPMMHRRLLPAEMWRWYGQDVIVPGLAAFCAAALARLLAPLPMLGAPFVSALVLGLAAAASLSAAVLATPLGREGLRRYVWPLLTITRIRK